MKKYNIIYSDPPWSYDDKAKNRGGAERHYITTDIDELCKMPVPEICADDCIMFMWATFPKIQEALQLLEAWGFQYKTNAFTWVKKNKIKESWFWGMGRWTRSNAEICLLGIKGKPQRVGKGVHSVIDAVEENSVIVEKIMAHSKKPDIVRDKIIELCGDLPRLEMFARTAPEGWDVFGNEAPGSIELSLGLKQIFRRF